MSSYKKIGDYCTRCHNRWIKTNTILRIDESTINYLKNKKSKITRNKQPPLLNWDYMKNIKITKLRVTDMKTKLSKYIMRKNTKIRFIFNSYKLF